MKSKHITLKDVSKKAGVHPSTVSLCLNNSSLVAEKTKNHVLNIARELGYRPHPHLSALMRSRRLKNDDVASPTLGFVTFHPTKDGWKKRLPALRQAMDGARRKAHARGFQLEEVWLPLSEISAEKVTDALQSRNISGALLAPLPTQIATLDWPWDRFATVAIGSSLREPRLHRVRGNHFGSLHLAMSECHRLGYRRPGLALPEEVNRRMDYRWLASYLVNQTGLNLDDRPRPFCTDDWTKESFLQWVRGERPDVIISCRSTEPLRWLRSAGYSIPEDIGFVKLSIPSLRSKLSGIYENWELQGESGTMVLIDLLTDNEFGLQDSPVISIVDNTWNPGTTLRRVD